MEPIVPFTLTIACFRRFRVVDPELLRAGSNLQQLMLNFAEQGLVAIAMAFSVLSGGIDLSVGSVFAMSNFLALYFFLIFGLPLPVMIVVVLAFGALMGAVNGGMIAYGKNAPVPDHARRAHHRSRGLQQGDCGLYRRARQHQQRQLGLGLHGLGHDSGRSRPTWRY